MKIVVLDGRTLNPGDNPWDPLAALGELVVYETTPREQIPQRARDADVVVTNKTRLSAEILHGLPRLRLISILATGYDNVDVAAAHARGITVCNVPGYATDSVAQHVFALLFELCHRTTAHDRAVRDGEWARRGDFSFWLEPPVELRDLVLGVVGYGRIGRRVAEIARALGMRVLAAARSGSALADWPQRKPLPELFARSDVVSLHCPLTPETSGIIDATALACMKPTAFLINTARGMLVDELALAEALCERRIAGAGLDTIAREPIDVDNPLLGAPNCVITPHLAWASLAARRRLLLATADNVRAFASHHAINVVGGPEA